ncbi:acyl-CoA N-acyltransferase [Aspergillus avenaceus]|uniref:Acyl-CoA N-acyltransferase n=1 Tax=Aspergillus avenaceus TaxID=36643 RepID=A0A5N6TKN7_ASPAV|nr:acyl-CoA N-acyltransferase [Aspergillus avenaceus]
MSTDNPPFRIIPAQSSEHINAVRGLFTAYTAWLGLDLTFQGFAAELQSLPGQYAAPCGELLLAYSTEGDTPIGCAAVRPLKQSSDAERGVSGGDCCEMKRLYVVPEARGMGLGKALMNAAIQRAKDLGYTEMRLDTLPSMQGAVQLYERLGFLEIPAYYETPLEGTLFLALELR